MSSNIERSLADIVGSENTDLDGAGTIVWPSSTGQVSRIVEVANDAHVSVRYDGFVSFDGAEVIPDAHPSIIVQRERLRGNWEYRRKDLLLSVGAGIVLGEISAFLKSDKLIWPGMIGYDEDDQLGGVLDSAPSQGTQKGRRIRRFVYGLVVVLPTGEVARLGSRTVKSVAGYDLKSLCLGSMSCFGMVTECDLQLASEEDALVEAPDYDEFDAGMRGEPSGILEVLRDLKNRVDRNGILPSLESVGLGEECIRKS